MTDLSSFSTQQESLIALGFILELTNFLNHLITFVAFVNPQPISFEVFTRITANATHYRVFSGEATLLFIVSFVLYSFPGNDTVAMTVFVNAVFVVLAAITDCFAHKTLQACALPTKRLSMHGLIVFLVQGSNVVIQTVFLASFFGLLNSFSTMSLALMVCAAVLLTILFLKRMTVFEAFTHGKGIEHTKKSKTY